MVDFELWSSEVKKFGFGDITKIDLNGEKKGIVPDRSYMNERYKDKGGWSTGHLLNLSIGQGEIMVTPIQIANLMNIIQKLPGPLLIFLGAFCLSFGGLIVKSFEGATLWQILFWRQLFFVILVYTWSY